MVKYIKTEDGYKNPKSLELSKFTNDLYGNQLILSLAGTPSGDEIEESIYDSRATYFDQYIGFNSEKLDNFDLRDTDFLCTLKLGNQTFTFSRDNTTVYNDSPGNDAADEYYLVYGSWDEENWDFSDGASPLYCLEMDLYRSDEEPYYWLNVYGNVNDSVADSISFTYDIIEREPKKIPKEYLEVSDIQITAENAQATANNAQATANNAQTTANNAQTTANGKMDANNPIGTGSFSMNRTNGVYIGTNSTTIGTSNVAKAANQLTTGQYNAYSNISYIPDKLKSYASLKSILIYLHHNVWYSKKCYITDNDSGILEDAEYLYFTSNASDIRNQMLELYNEIGAFWFGLHTSLTEDHEGDLSNIYYYDGAIDSQGNNDRADYWLYRLADFDLKPITHEANNYSFVVGNGTSNTERSNAHTLDWNGNAWYSGDVYTGSTSGKNKDEGSKKLATEEYADNAVVNKITAPTTAAVGQTIRVSEVDDTGKPTGWEAVDLVNKEEWTLITDATVEEEVQSLVYTFADIPLKKMTVMIDTPAASADTTYCPVIIGTAKDGNPNFYTVKFYPKAIPTKLAATTVIAAEFIEVGENVYTSVKTTYQPLRGTAIENIGSGSPITSHITRHYVDAYKDQPYPNITRFSIETYATFPVGTTIKIIGVRA